MTDVKRKTKISSFALCRKQLTKWVLPSVNWMITWRIMNRSVLSDCWPSLESTHLLRAIDRLFGQKEARCVYTIKYLGDLYLYVYVGGCVQQVRAASRCIRVTSYKHNMWYSTFYIMRVYYSEEYIKIWYEIDLAVFVYFKRNRFIEWYFNKEIHMSQNRSMEWYFDK